MLYWNRTKTTYFFFSTFALWKIPFGPPHLGIKITSQASDLSLLLFTHFLLATECNTTLKREKKHIHGETLGVKKAASPGSALPPKDEICTSLVQSYL